MSDIVLRERCCCVVDMRLLLMPVSTFYRPRSRSQVLQIFVTQTNHRTSLVQDSRAFCILRSSCVWMVTYAQNSLAWFLRSGADTLRWGWNSDSSITNAVYQTLYIRSFTSHNPKKILLAEQIKCKDSRPGFVVQECGSVVHLQHTRLASACHHAGPVKARPNKREV